MSVLETKQQVVRAGRRSTDPHVMTTRVPKWVAPLLIALVVVNIAMASVLVRANASDVEEAEPSFAAIKALEGELEDSPNDPRILLQLGFEYRKAGMLDDALRVNRRVADMDPKDTASRYHVGSILLAMGDDTQAETALWDVLEIEPTHATAAKSLGDLYASRGQYKSMLVAIEPAAVEHPEVADLQYLWGLGKERTGDKAGARRAYWLAAERDSDLVKAREGYERLKAGEQ